MLQLKQQNQLVEVEESCNAERKIFEFALQSPEAFLLAKNKAPTFEFTSKFIRDGFAALADYVTKCKKFPEDLDNDLSFLVANKLPKDERSQSLYNYIRSLIEKSDPNIVHNEQELDFLIERFRKEKVYSEYKNLLVKSIDTLSTSNIDDIVSNIRSMSYDLTKISSGYNSNSFKEIRVFDNSINRLFSADTRKKKKHKIGIRKMDEILGGWREGELSVLIGATGKGKSIILLNFAELANKNGANVVFANIEMSEHEVNDRYNSLVSGIEHDKIRKELMSKQEKALFYMNVLARSIVEEKRTEFKKEFIKTRPKSKKELRELFEKYAKYPYEFHFWHVPKNCSVAFLESEISRMTMTMPIDILIVDHLNIMSPSTKAGTGDTLREHTMIVRELKQLALMKKLCIITAAQMDMNVKPGMPITTDAIKYCKAIGENADWGIGFRQTDEDVLLNRINLELAKHRHARPSTISIGADFERMRIIDNQE